MKRETLEPKIPFEMRKVVSAPGTRVLWKDLTPLARRDFVMWVESAKQPETRTRRIESIPSRLTSGKRRPCCFAIVPMDLYKALGPNAKAKATWKDLSPDKRRDFASWIGSAKTPAEHERRTEKAIRMLAAGKRHP